MILIYFLRFLFRKQQIHCYSIYIYGGKMWWLCLLMPLAQYIKWEYIYLKPTNTFLLEWNKKFDGRSQIKKLLHAQAHRNFIFISFRFVLLFFVPSWKPFKSKPNHSNGLIHLAWDKLYDMYKLYSICVRGKLWLMLRSSTATTVEHHSGCHCAVGPHRCSTFDNYVYSVE